MFLNRNISLGFFLTGKFWPGRGMVKKFKESASRQIEWLAFSEVFLLGLEKNISFGRHLYAETKGRCFRVFSNKLRSVRKILKLTFARKFSLNSSKNTDTVKCTRSKL